MTPDQKPLNSTMMVDFFAKEEEQTLAQANLEVIEFLMKKPLSEPRIMQTFLCRTCLNPVTQVPKSANEYIQLRAVLMIPDSAIDPPICNSCYEHAIGAFNRHATNVGTSNSGHTNLVLAQLR